MKYVVLFEDDPEVGSDVRRTYMSEHLAFLERSADQVESAGALRTTEGEGAGGIWIVEAESAVDVDSLVKQDPFWPTGLRKSVQILEWNQVFAGGQRLTTPR
jgi:hypothetical protein